MNTNINPDDFDDWYMAVIIICFALIMIWLSKW